VTVFAKAGAQSSTVASAHATTPEPRGAVDAPVRPNIMFGLPRAKGVIQRSLSVRGEQSLW
jgi:hypothetical protein